MNNETKDKIGKYIESIIHLLWEVQFKMNKKNRNENE